jgi:hypothetical protein
VVGAVICLCFWPEGWTCRAIKIRGDGFTNTNTRFLTGDIHEEILRGRDTEIVWEDIFMGDELRTAPGFHDELERKVRMQ